MSAELHDQIRAEVDRRLAIARAATPGPWESHIHYPEGAWPREQPADDEQMWLISTTLSLAPSADAAYLGVHDPADAIRRYEYALKVLDRHALVKVPTNLGPMAACAFEWADGDGHVQPIEFCAELVDLATSLGIEVSS